MATFLINPKMSAALRARVEASVLGRGRIGRGAERRLRWVIGLRAAAFLALVSAVALMLWGRHERAQELSRARDALLSKVEQQASRLSADRLRIPERIEELLVGLYADLENAAAAAPPDSDSDSDAGVAPEGARSDDWVAERIRGEKAWSQLMHQPLIYYRGPLQSLESAEGVRAAALDSHADAFVHCLIQPPSSRDEKAVRRQVFDARSEDGRVVPELSHAFELRFAHLGLPWLGPRFTDRVRSAPSLVEVDALGQQFDRADVELTIRTAQARLLVYAIDGPKRSGSVVELDGGSVHPIDVGIVDLESGESLLRLRRWVDPAWVSEKRRPYLSWRLNGCRLAFDIRQRVLATE